MNKISLFHALSRWAVNRYTVTDPKTGISLDQVEFRTALIKAFPHFDELVKVYNECIDAFERLSPTHRTLFFVYIKDTFQKPFEMLTIVELSNVLNWCLSRMK